MTRTLTPAYGRDYKSKAQAIEDFKKGKDFVLSDIGPYAGSYCSIRDFEVGEQVKLRYNKLRSLTFYRKEEK